MSDTKSTIQQLIDEKRSYIERLERHREYLEALEDAASSIGAWISVFDTWVTVYVDVGEEETLEQAIARFLRATRGLSSGHTKPEPNCDDKGVWTLRLTGVPFQTTGFIQLSKSENAVCQLKQIGEKTVPVYEVRCGEAES